MKSITLGLHYQTAQDHRCGRDEGTGLRQNRGGRTWLPSELMDEMIPPTRPLPDSWIASLDDGAPALDNGGEDDDRRLTRLQDGQVVGFRSLTDHGNVALTIRSETDWTADPPMPPEAKQVCAMQGWQIDSLANSVEECVQALVEHEQGGPGEYELSYYTWSGDIPHRFDAKARTFRAVGTTNG
jgi:hypothetical protein